MFRKIMAFVAVAEEESYSAAARRLNVAQPWVSVQIKQLEELLGYRVLIRNKRSVRLTAEGTRLLAKGKILCAAYCDLKEEADRIRRERYGLLRIACEPSTQHDPTRYNIIQRFLKAYPNHTVKIVNKTTENLFADLEDRKVDIIYAPIPPRFQDLYAVATSRYELEMLVPAGHKLYDKKVIDCHDFRGLKILTGSRSYMLRSLTLENQQALSEVSWIEPPEIEYESRYHMVEMLGVPSLWISFPDQPHHLPDNLRAIPLKAPIYSNFGFCALRDVEDATVRRFMNLVSNHASPEFPQSNECLPVAGRMVAGAAVQIACNPPRPSGKHPPL